MEKLADAPTSSQTLGLDPDPDMEIDELEQANLATLVTLTRAS